MQFGRSRQSWRSRHQCHRRTSVYHGELQELTYILIFYCFVCIIFVMMSYLFLTELTYIQEPMQAALAELFRLRQPWQVSGPALVSHPSPRGSGSTVRNPHMDDVSLISPWSPRIGSSRRRPLQQAHRPSPGARRRRRHIEQRRRGGILAGRRVRARSVHVHARLQGSKLRSVARWEAAGGIGGLRMSVNVPYCRRCVRMVTDLGCCLGACCGSSRRWCPCIARRACACRQHICWWIAVAGQGFVPTGSLNWAKFTWYTSLFGISFYGTTSLF
jgi:hypothetical protein